MMRDNNKLFKFLLEKKIDEVKYIYNTRYISYKFQIKGILLKRINKKYESNIILSHKSLDNKSTVKKSFKNKNQKKKNIKNKLINENKDLVKNVFLPLTLSGSKNIYRTYKELNPKKNHPNSIKNLSYTKYLLSLREYKNTQKGKISSLGITNNTNNINNANNISNTNNINTNNNINNLNHISTFQNSNDQLLIKYKINKNKVTELNSNYYYNNENENTKEREENNNNIRIYPIIKKKSIRNIICDKKYHENEIKNLLNNKKENNYVEITKKNKEDKLRSFLKHKNSNNIIKRNISNNIKKYDTFNKIQDSSIILDKINTKNHIDSPKKIENNKINKFVQKNDDINKFKNSDSYRTYFLMRKNNIKRKKNNNEDILQVLNINE